MDMGGGMTHTDTMGSDGSTSSTNCMDIGGGMKSCNTMRMGQPVTSSPTPDMSQPQTNGSTLSYIGGLIARSQEKSFQKRVVQKLEAGDCHGAANLAFAHQRYELSDKIRQSCLPSDSVAETAPPSDTITMEQFMAGEPVPFDPSKPYQVQRDFLPAAFDPNNSNIIEGHPWVVYSFDQTGGVSFSYPTPLKKKGETSQVWIKVDYSKDRTVKARESIRLYEVSCHSQTIQTLESLEYDSRGMVLSSFDEPTKPSRIVPETVDSALYIEFCVPQMTLEEFKAEEARQLSTMSQK
jgi:hypothetical protein